MLEIFASFQTINASAVWTGSVYKSVHACHRRAVTEKYPLSYLQTALVLHKARKPQLRILTILSTFHDPYSQRFDSFFYLDSFVDLEFLLAANSWLALKCTRNRCKWPKTSQKNCNRKILLLKNGRISRVRETWIIALSLRFVRWSVLILTSPVKRRRIRQGLKREKISIMYILLTKEETRKWFC